MLASNRDGLRSLQVADEQNIIEQAKKLQAEIASSLTLKYAKAFDPVYRPNFFSNKDRFNSIKKPLARALRVVCESELNSTVEVACFLNCYEYTLKANYEGDPQGILGGLFDTIRLKPEGGKLGGLLAERKENVSELKNALQQYANKELEFINFRLALLQEYLAMNQEMLYANLLTNNFNTLGFYELPEQHYHKQRIKDLLLKFGLQFDIDSMQIESLSTSHTQIASSMPDIIVAEITELQANFPDEGSKVWEFIKLLHEKRNALIDERMKYSLIESIIQTPDLKAKDRIKYVVTGEIIKKFAETLLTEEKMFFWLLSMRIALYSNLRQCNKHVVYTGKDDLPETAKQFYNHNGYSSLLSNKALLDDLVPDLEAENNGNYNKNTTESMMERIDTHLTAHFSGHRLRDLSVLENKQLWSPLFERDGYLQKGYQWRYRLERLIRESLVLPIMRLETSLAHEQYDTLDNTIFAQSPVQLPAEIVENIVKKFGQNELITLSLVSKAMAATVKEYSQSPNLFPENSREALLYRTNTRALMGSAARSLKGVMALEASRAEEYELALEQASGHCPRKI